MKKKNHVSEEELFEFIRSGCIIDEYGKEITPDEFIEMATTWGVDGYDSRTYYKENPSHIVAWIDLDKYHDTYVDELRVSNSTDFS